MPMGMGQSNWAGNWLKVADSGSKAGTDLLSQRYQSLQRQVPMLYMGVLACFLGLHLATSGELAHFASPMTGVILLVLYRLLHWLRTGRRVLSAPRMERELKGTLLFSIVFSAVFCGWALYLFDQSTGQRQFVLLFGSLACVGCAYGLSSFPKAARVPLVVLGLPLALRSMLTGEMNFIGAGIALTLIIFLVSRVLTVHSRNVEELTQSRSEKEVERERAQEAERVAVAERANADTLAHTDYLTGLANRRAFINAIGSHVMDTEAATQLGALAVIDLDGFKPINDAFGHATGDAVIKIVADRLRLTLGGPGVCARVGGDEFAVLLPDCSSEVSAQKLGAQICTTLEEPIYLAGRELKVSACCGLTMLQREDRHASDALLRADTALYAAKERGRSNVSLFSHQMELKRRRRSEIEKALCDPATRSRIDLVYQPILNLRSGQVASYEALARWSDERLGDVPASEFILVAEQIGVIEDISDHLLRKAVAEAVTWPDEVALSFNLSTVQLCSRTLAARILCEIDKQGLAPHRLQIEVTETMLLVDFEAARANLSKLRAEGVRVVLDDFGAGFASISYLQEMQFDCVKLDGSLIERAATSLSSKQLLQGVIKLCSSLCVPCVAEQVETEEQLHILLNLKCEKAQGYFLSKPLTAKAARALVSPRARWHSGAPAKPASQLQHVI